MTPYLPYEIVQGIVQHLHRLSDLAICCRTSHIFLPIARARLYEHVRISYARYLHPRDYITSRSFDMTGSYGNKRTELVLNTLLQSPHLRLFVRSVEVRLGAISDCPVQLPARLEDLLHSLPSLKTATLEEDSASDFCFDEAVERYQRNHWKRWAEQGEVEGEEKRILPTFRVSFRRNLTGTRARTPSAAYDRVAFEPRKCFALGSLILPSFLEASTQTLTRLDIPLGESVILSNFTRLEHLILRLNAHVPSRVIANLSRTLPTAPILRRLTLTGTAHEEDLAELLGGGQLVRLLPPLLSGLSFEYKVPISSVLSFFDDLSRPSNVRRLNFAGLAIRTSADCDGPSKVEEEDKQLHLAFESARERGIHLSFGPRWTIWWYVPSLLAHVGRKPTTTPRL